MCFPALLFAEERKYEFTKQLMGSHFRLVFYSESDSVAHLAAEKVFDRLDDLNEVMSDYLDASEVNRLSRLSGRGSWVRTSSDLFTVIDSALVLSQKTKGAFDFTIGPIIQVWRRASRLKTFPRKKEIRMALKKSGYRYLEVDRDHGMVRLLKPNMRLDFGGIGKGYAADEGIRLLKELGIRSAMVDAGGDLALSDPPPGRNGWRISISSGKETDEDEVVSIANCGLATSGATYRYLEHRGKRYSHIVDPRTGVGLLESVRATVLAPSAAQADALATAVSVSGLKGSEKFQSQFPGTKFWIQGHEN